MSASCIGPGVPCRLAKAPWHAPSAVTTWPALADVEDACENGVDEAKCMQRANSARIVGLGGLGPGTTAPLAEILPQCIEP